LNKLFKVQIIACGPGLKEISEIHGVSSEWVREMIKNEALEIEIVKAYLGEFPSVSDNCAWIIMGSRYSAYDKMDWIENLKKNICLAVDNKIPILGICFGHQLLCSALGAEVSNNPEGWEIGSSKVSLTDKGVESPLFKDFDDSFYVYQSHHDVVSQLPPNVDLLCSNKFGVQSVSFSDHVFGVQFHPEFSYSVMSAYFNARTKDLNEEDFQVLDINDGNRIVSNFINIFLKEG